MVDVHWIKPPWSEYRDSIIPKKFLSLPSSFLNKKIFRWVYMLLVPCSLFTFFTDEWHINSLLEPFAGVSMHSLLIVGNMQRHFGPNCFWMMGWTVSLSQDFSVQSWFFVAAIISSIVTWVLQFFFGIWSLFYGFKLHVVYLSEFFAYVVVRQSISQQICILYLLHLYRGFYSYTEGATWKIRDLLTETLLI